MKTIHHIDKMQQEMLLKRREQKSIGFVPTMGFLHEGHVSLLEKARRDNDIVVLSIFVNPLQFGPNEDFDAYPRDFERDEELAQLAGADYIFYPTKEEMYPQPLSVTMKVQDRTDVLCGRSREGHFDGVVTVLTKLFHIVMPDRAYFGLKDAQQAAIVERLIRDFHFSIEFVPVKTKREEDGLAKSSRNVYLSELERREAKELYQALLLAKSEIEKGESQRDTLLHKMVDHIQNNTSGKIDYIDIYSYPDLIDVAKLEGKIIIALAVKFSKARLIDNLILNVDELQGEA